MYERFTDRARKVMQLANQEAQRLNHEYIGTEHILLGLAKEGTGKAANALKNLDVDLRKIRLEVDKLVQCGPEMVTIDKLPHTPRAKKVIEYSMEEARDLDCENVGTEHLLLGLLREADGVATQVLMNLGLTLEAVREEVLALQENEGPSEESSSDTDQPQARKTALEYFTAPALPDMPEVLIGRDDVLNRLVAITQASTENKAILVGPPGVGKSAILGALDQHFAGIVASHRKRIRMIFPNLLISGTKYRGQLEERIAALMNEAKRECTLVLGIDNAERLFEVGLGIGDQGESSLLPALSWYLSDWPVPIVLAMDDTAFDKYSKHPCLKRYEKVEVKPVEKKFIRDALNGHVGRLELHHQVQFQAGVIAAVAEAVSDIQPAPIRSGLRLLERAAGIAHISKHSELLALKQEYERLMTEKDRLVAVHDFEKAVEARDQADRCMKAIKLVTQNPDNGPLQIGVDAIGQVSNDE